ncbi:MAG: AAA family ATPase [Formivibrio sp.]|nr:AAA family ATPase [Formivibrio sp.]
MKRPTIIAFSGIDGAGKTSAMQTITRSMGWRYRKQKVGRRYVKVEEEYRSTGRALWEAVGSEFGQRLSEAYLADLLEYKQRYVHNNLVDKYVYLFDRWTFCLYAYANFMKCKQVAQQALEIAPSADLTILVDADATVAHQRILKARRPDWEEDTKSLERYRESYLECVRTFSSEVAVLNGNATHEQLVQSSKECIMSRLRLSPKLPRG